MEKTDQPESKLRSWDCPGDLKSAEASGPWCPGHLLSGSKISSCWDFSSDLQSIFPCHLSAMGGRAGHLPGRGQVPAMFSQAGRGRGHWLSWRSLGQGGQVRNLTKMKREKKSNQKPSWYIIQTQILVVCLGQGWHLPFKQDTPGNTEPAGPLATLWIPKLRHSFSVSKLPLWESPESTLLKGLPEWC